MSRKATTTKKHLNFDSLRKTVSERDQGVSQLDYDYEILDDRDHD